MIIAVTGHSEQSYIQKALDSGMNMVLSKPIELNQLKKMFSTLDFKINSTKVARKESQLL